jgi:23S rRNA pseudouridine1911/1915/1917 synthase
LDILAETDQFVAVNKPSGLLSIPDRANTDLSLKGMLDQIYGRVLTVHRLDRDTSGVIVYARDEASHQYLSRQFESRQVKKFYRGFVHGQPIHSSGSMDGPIMEHPVKKGSMIVHAKGKASLTDYQVLESFGILSFLEFEIHTGRTHQIRVHAKDLGHPIAADPTYGDGQPILLSSFKRKFKLSKYVEEERPILSRLALHAWKLQFIDPLGKPWEIEAPLPKDMAALLQQLRKWKSS